jgi:FkbM family methyltransferase
VTFEKLSNSLHAPNIQIYNLGFSNLDGQATIYDHESEDGSEHASLFKDVIEIIHHDKVVEHRIQLRTIDSFVHENKIQRIGLLKIDTEGNELNVLLGAKETLKDGKIDIIHFEFNDMNMISKVFMRDFIHALSSYNVYRLLPKGLLKLDYEKPVLMELFSYQNIIAIRKEIDQR